MTRRRLRPEEIELWREVTRTAERLHPERPETSPLSKPSPQNKKKAPIAPFLPGEKAHGRSVAHDVLPGLPERLTRAPLKMDRKAFGKLKRGKLAPEARIDLHGMTLAQAQPALTAFILRSQAESKRLVLVITGKGKARDDDGPIPERPGILRHNVPHWLSSPPLAQAVLQVAQAHLKHGGGGAYYVYLRRR